MTSNEAYKLFAPWIDEIRVQDLKNIAKIAFSNLPDYFFTKPASSTGKYHPAFSNKDGGLVLHTLYALEVWKYLYKGFRDKLILPDTYDCGIIAVMFHDALKYGDPEENNKYSTKTHPEDAAEWMRQIIIRYVYDQEWSMQNKRQFLHQCEYCIVKPIEHHQGPWSNHGAPETLMQQLVFIADYVASQPTFEKDVFQCENN